MDRTSSFPKQDFEGMVCEIWSGLDICLYHAAYVRTYADSTAMRLADSRRRETILQQMSQADRDLLQEDVLVFRAHFAGFLWQLHHLADELVRLAYKRCYQEDIVTKERYDALVKAVDDDPLLKEFGDYRNLSHQCGGGVVTLHDGTTDAFIAHVLPPLDVQAPAQRATLDEQEIQKDVTERELNMKLQSYCDHVSGYCEGLFRIIDTKHKMAVIPRSRGFLVTIPHSYQGKLPEGAKDVIYVTVHGSAINEEGKQLALTPRFIQAVDYARQIHTGWRKGTQVPYMAHLLGVASLVMGEIGNVPLAVTEDMVIAALLHDAVEDEGGLPRLHDIEAKFGKEVADIVKGCTDSFEVASNKKQKWEVRKASYIERLREEPDEPEGTLLVSAADKLYNARAILEDYKQIGAEVWKRFKRGRDQQLWYFDELIKVYEARCPGWRIVEELKLAVGELRRTSAGEAS